MIRRDLPRFLRRLSAVADCWLVGSAAFAPEGTSPKDWDVVVTPETWATAAVLIPADARPNTHGGWKFQVDGVEFDVWPDRIERLCLRPLFSGGVHLSSGFELRRGL